MLKSGAKLLLIGLVMLAIGAPLAKATDGMHGRTADICIGVSIVLCLAGVSTALYGLVKVLAGCFERT